MPNHVLNLVSFSGNNEDVKLAMNNLVNSEGLVDFNLALPIPEKLVNSIAPTYIISEREYEEQERKIKSGEDIYRRGLSRKASNRLIKECGYDNWYDWQINSWGTKWNAYESSVTGENSVSFSTAWSAPIKFLTNFSKLNPNVKITLKYADEDCGYNLGELEIKNGDITDTNIPKGGSIEAYELYCEIQGEHISEFINNYIEDYINDESDIDEIKDDNFAFTLVKLMIKHKLSDIELFEADNFKAIVMGIALEENDDEYVKILKSL